MYPQDLNRLEAPTLMKYLQLAVSEMMRFHQIVVSLTSDVDNSNERIEFIRDALIGSAPGSNAEQRKANATTSPLLVKEKLARVYYKRIFERARYGYKYHAEYRTLLDSLLNHKTRERGHNNGLQRNFDQGYTSPYIRDHQRPIEPPPAPPTSLGVPNAQPPYNPPKPR